MEIIYSHIKEPIRQGESPTDVYARFAKKIEESEPGPTVAKAKALNDLKLAVGLAWDEVRPIAIMNRNSKAKQLAKDAKEEGLPPHTCGEHG